MTKTSLKRATVTDRGRLIILAINIVVGFFLYALFTGHFIPTSGIASSWIVGAISVWLLNLLATPFFTPPRDAIIAGIGSAVMLITMDFPDISPIASGLEFARIGFVLYAFLTIVVAVTASFLFRADERSPTSAVFYRLTEFIGRGEVLFGAPAFLGTAAAFYASPLILTLMLLTWLVLFTARPVERIFELVISIQSIKDTYSSMPTVGEIDRIDHPEIVRVRLSKPEDWKTKRLYTVGLPNGEQRHVLGLFSQVKGTDVIGTGMMVGEPVSDQYTMPNGAVIMTDHLPTKQTLVETLSGGSDAEIAGFVVETSRIAVVQFEASPHVELRKGDVVYIRLASVDIFYQILDAKTEEENFENNPRGRHIVEAMQLGSYDPEKGFQKYDWLPSMNTCVFHGSVREFPKLALADDEISIGKIPATDIDVGVSINDLVEYHSAVLGVTGTGKTELALKVIREAVARGVKVICVDFTGDYKQRLKDLDPEFPQPSKTDLASFEKALFDVATGTFGAKDERRVLQKFLDGFQPTVADQMEKFLLHADANLAILELSEITNTRATLRLTELYLSAVMLWASKNRKQEQILIVLEEAHTIIPETFGAGFDADTQWVVGRIGQIALQGRKYGVGLMLVSQRTALVSKTILSQCNTFFTHGLIDQTSLTFLQSVYSNQHTSLIPNLGKFQLLASGKAIKAERPVIVQREFDPEIEKAVSELE